MKQIVDGYTNFEKDLKSGSIVNRDLKTYEILKRKKKLRNKQAEEFNELKTKVDTLTSLVEKLIEKVDK